jgi:hypothetical protein
MQRSEIRDARQPLRFVPDCAALRPRYGYWNTTPDFEKAANFSGEIYGVPQ